jgi:prepilin-type N-terminal cleavage/methylation domain-containing protein
MRNMGHPNRNSGFTFIEVLATLVLMAIVLPVAMRGVSISLASAEKAKHLSEGAALADAKLNELVSTGEWSSGGLQGDFGQDFPGYRWQAQAASRDFGVTEIVLTVTWQERGQDRSVNVSTLVSDTANGNGGSGVLPI